MPFSRATISSASVAIDSLAVEMEDFASEIDRLWTLIWSSAMSNSAAQYSFLLSSSTCSFFSTCYAALHETCVSVVISCESVWCASI